MKRITYNILLHPIYQVKNLKIEDIVLRALAALWWGLFGRHKFFTIP